MAIEIFECEQNSDEWMRARMGIPTASMFATVMAKGKDGGASVTRKTYLYKLAGEILTGEPMETYQNSHMERGHVMEPEARDLYCFAMDMPLTRVGFVRNGSCGCSPDSLIGENGVLEIKTAAPHILVEYLLAGKFPAEHVAQTQGALMVTGRTWVDIAIYWPKMPLFTCRAYRDEPYIAKLSAAVDLFNEELAQVVARVRAYAPQIASAA